MDFENCPWEAGPEDHLQIDLASQEDVVRGASELLNRLDGRPLHALVNNAGISPKSKDGSRLDSLTTPMNAWQQVFQVNVFAPIMMTKAFAEPLQRGKERLLMSHRLPAAECMILLAPPMQHQRRPLGPLPARWPLILASWGYV